MTRNLLTLGRRMQRSTSNSLTVPAFTRTTGARRAESTKATTSSQQTTEKATEPLAPEEPVAKGWLKRMAPPKGGTELPDAKFMAVAAIVGGAGFYAWFIDAPTPS